ncbi:unnamed protein product [Caenorhabditis auriculariae]|uniref:3-beta hydroxysteroid dehydrogenase/isomerase domain-containing protein n=1 Tax=Caenorhabditis auriculariae TaxID=2777116 RepID=A0A8S1HBY3_9PELO|nr:unnamed protein product [Caenorhabditis auriculariae]
MIEEKKTLVIGGGGYLGAHLVKMLLGEGFEVSILDLELRKFNVVPIEYEKIHFFKGSFLDEKLLDRSMSGCTSVFHLAAIGMSGSTGGNKASIMKVNAEGTDLVIRKCRENDVQSLIFASSVCVVFTGSPLLEADETLPYPDEQKLLSHYCYSKVLAEKAVLAASDDSLRTISLRFRGIFGPGEPRSTERAVSVIKSSWWCAIAQQGCYEARTSYSSVRNCAKAFILAEKATRKGKYHGRAYNIVDSEIHGAFSFWNDLIQVLGFQPPTLVIPYYFVKPLSFFVEMISYMFLVNPPFTQLEMALMCVDNTFSHARATEELGYHPEPSMMPEVVQYYAEQEQKTKKISLKPQHKSAGFQQHTQEPPLITPLFALSAVGCLLSSVLPGTVILCGSLLFKQPTPRCESKFMVPRSVSPSVGVKMDFTAVEVYLRISRSVSSHAIKIGDLFNRGYHHDDRFPEAEHVIDALATHDACRVLWMIPDVFYHLHPAPDQRPPLPEVLGQGLPYQNAVTMMRALTHRFERIYRALRYFSRYFSFAERRGLYCPEYFRGDTESAKRIFKPLVRLFRNFWRNHPAYQRRGELFILP